jgi:hypothetical protein
MATPALSSTLRQLVIERAQGKCEYCCLHQDVSIYRHEIDHIIAQKHGGQTSADNLALACLPCNRAKGSDLTTFDPLSNDVVPLFHPRRQSWTDHFTFDGVHIIGLTPIGRATVLLLRLNAPARILQRQVLRDQNRYP